MKALHESFKLSWLPHRNWKSATQLPHEWRESRLTTPLWHHWTTPFPWHMQCFPAVCIELCSNWRTHQSQVTNELTTVLRQNTRRGTLHEPRVTRKAYLMTCAYASTLPEHLNRGPRRFWPTNVMRGRLWATQRTVETDLQVVTFPNTRTICVRYYSPKVSRRFWAVLFHCR